LPHALASAYLDKRVYGQVTEKSRARFVEHLLSFDLDTLWQRALELPEEWQTDAARASLSACMNALADPVRVNAIVDQVQQWSEQQQAEAMRRTPMAMGPQSFSFGQGECSAVA